MTQDRELLGKTFDQQLKLADADIAVRDIYPNRRIPGEIVFEPLGTGIRVTARDADHRVLWGYVGAKETVKQVHCLVAVYDTLQSLLAEELDKRGLLEAEPTNPITSALAALDKLEKTTKWLRESLEVKKMSDATLERARTVAQIASNAERQISLEAGTLKGMKSKTE